MEITEQFKQLIIELAREFIIKYEQVTAKDIFEMLYQNNINKQTRKEIIKVIASVLATAHRTGEFIAEHTILTDSAYKKVSTYHKPLN